MIIADGVLIQACIKTDIAFQLPYFFLQGVDLLVDGFQFLVDNIPQNFFCQKSQNPQILFRLIPQNSQNVWQKHPEPEKSLLFWLGKQQTDIKPD